MILDSFKDSIMYPFKKISNWVILALFIVLFYAIYILEGFGVPAKEYDLVALVLGIIAIIFVLGFILSIIKNTINGDGDVPSFSLLKNGVDGLKTFLLGIFYFLVPVLVISICSFLVGEFDLGLGLIDHIIISGSFVDLFTNLLPYVTGDFLIVTIIGLVFFVFFGLLFLIAIAKLAENDDISSAININGVIKKIGEIGWKKYISFAGICAIIVILLDTVIDLVADIFGTVGFLISVLIILPFIYIFVARALGLIYRNVI